MHHHHSARIHPEKALGVDIGDIHVVRNAGGRAADALRSVTISQQARRGGCGRGYAVVDGSGGDSGVEVGACTAYNLISMPALQGPVKSTWRPSSPLASLCRRPLMRLIFPDRPPPPARPAPT